MSHKFQKLQTIASDKVYECMNIENGDKFNNLGFQMGKIFDINSKLVKNVFETELKYLEFFVVFKKNSRGISKNTYEHSR
jgi:hypothetical protein